MRIFLLLMIFALPVWATGEISCPPVIEAQTIIDSVQFEGCSQRNKEAINYKETTIQAKKSAKNLLAPLCKSTSKYIASCIIISKDASVRNEIIAKICSNASADTPLCVLTAVAEKKSEDEMIKECLKVNL